MTAKSSVRFSSYSDTAGTVIANQVEELYNGFGQLTNEYQAHSGPVDTGVGGTPQTQYGYSNDNISRLTSMTYPNGRVIDYKYTTTLDNAISRVDQIYDATGSYIGPDQGYLYLGLGTIVQATDGNGVALSYIQQPNETNVLTSGGDRYTGLDEFGRIIDQNWVNLSTGVSTDRFQYGYDRNSNVLYKNNLLDPAMSELYHPNSSSSGDNNTAYDPLNRLTYFSRGTLSASGHNGGGGLDTIASPSASNSWNYDAVSNITASQSGGSRSLNAQNQITGMTGGSPTYYENGDMLDDPEGNRTFYDAWNRVVLEFAGSNTLSFSYDAQGRMIVDGSQITPIDLYYGRTPARGRSGSSSVIEERNGSSVTNQYVWGLMHVNSLALYDNGSRYYVQQDADWNTTSTVRTDGSVSGRLIYDPYGAFTVLKGDWSSADASVSVPLYRFQGGRWLLYARVYSFASQGFGRFYDPTLGVWKQPEPFETNYIDGTNLYQAMGDNPVAYVDPTGLDSLDIEMAGDASWQDHLYEPLDTVYAPTTAAGLAELNKYPNNSLDFISISGHGGAYEIEFGDEQLVPMSFRDDEWNRAHPGGRQLPTPGMKLLYKIRDKVAKGGTVRIVACNGEDLRPNLEKFLNATGKQVTVKLFSGKVTWTMFGPMVLPWRKGRKILSVPKAGGS